MADVCLYTYGSCGQQSFWRGQVALGIPATLLATGSRIQQVEVGVLAGINQSWCGHIQSSPEARVTGERRKVFASLSRRMISHRNESGGESRGKREQWGRVGAMIHHP